MTSQANVLIIDAGLGNIGSVKAAFNRLHCNSISLSHPPLHTESQLFTHVVLPGVGTFKAGSIALDKTGWGSWLLDDWLTYNRSLLGICLGMQLLASYGSEGSCENQPLLKGLNLVPGTVTQLPNKQGFDLPHIGWNSLHWNTHEHPLSFNLLQHGDMYFVHSYRFLVEDQSHELAWSKHSEKFSAAVGLNAIYGVQFHPEKSQTLGKKLLNNFISSSPC